MNATLYNLVDVLVFSIRNKEWENIDNSRVWTIFCSKIAYFGIVWRLYCLQELFLCFVNAIITHLSTCQIMIYLLYQKPIIFHSYHHKTNHKQFQTLFFLCYRSFLTFVLGYCNAKIKTSRKKSLTSNQPQPNLFYK